MKIQNTKINFNVERSITIYHLHTVFFEECSIQAFISICSLANSLPEVKRNFQRHFLLVSKCP